MNAEKEFLKDKFVEFQLRIADLNHALREQKRQFHEKENKTYLSLFEILDAFEAVDDTIETKQDTFDKTARMLGKNVRSIHKKLSRFIKSCNISRMAFPDNKARMGFCKIVDTQPKPEMENETILSIVKHGYVDNQNGTVIRKAEVITVLNEEKGDVHA
ncbi:MAG: nucleotide exchange factor GrpE [Deltaproteobacteria bacterium]|nr:nucleotide exchange factor GrpE [Deltaproteobacteria bacterium]